MFDPNQIQTITPQRPWKPLEVTLKATGEKVVIKDFRFNPSLHEDGKVVGPERTSPTPPVTNVTTDVPVITGEERFAFLKSKGWKSLDGPERKNYKELKAKFEPKKVTT